MKDLKHFLCLLTILSLGFGLFLIFDYNRVAQVGIVIALGGVYVLWGIIHHGLNKELHLKIILEYLLVAIFACTVIIFLLLRA